MSRNQLPVIRFLAAAVCLALAATSCEEEEPQEITALTISVWDPATGDPVSDVSICAGEDPHRWGVTGADGSATIPDLPQGWRAIRLSASLFVETRIEIKLSDDRQSVDVDLDGTGAEVDRVKPTIMAATVDNHAVYVLFSEKMDTSETEDAILYAVWSALDPCGSGEVLLSEDHDTTWVRSSILKVWHTEYEIVRTCYVRKDGRSYSYRGSSPWVLQAFVMDGSLTDIAGNQLEEGVKID